MKNQPDSTFVPEIFKYVSPSGLPILENSTLRIINPATLNDPFEALPRIPKITDELLEAKLTEESMLDLLAEDLVKKGNINQKSEITVYVESHKDVLLENLRNFFAANSNTMTPENFRKEVGQIFGITCFSETTSDILMWSHYAEKHAGFSIGFDAREFDGFVTSVIYSSARVEYSSLFHSKLRDYIFFKILRTKHLSWSYEQELRAIIPWEICEESDDGFHYLEFDPQSVTKIVLGSECLIKDQIISIAERKYPQAELLEATPHPQRYEMRVSNKGSG